MATLLSTPALPIHHSALVRSAVDLSQVILKALFGAREGHLGPGEAVSRKLLTAIVSSRGVGSPPVTSAAKTAMAGICPSYV